MGVKLGAAEVLTNTNIEYYERKFKHNLIGSWIPTDTSTPVTWSFKFYPNGIAEWIIRGPSEPKEETRKFFWKENKDFSIFVNDTNLFAERYDDNRWMPLDYKFTKQGMRIFLEFEWLCVKITCLLETEGGFVQNY